MVKDIYCGSCGRFVGNLEDLAKDLNQDEAQRMVDRLIDRALFGEGGKEQKDCGDMLYRKTDDDYGFCVGKVLEEGEPRARFCILYRTIDGDYNISTRVTLLPEDAFAVGEALLDVGILEADIETYEDMTPEEAKKNINRNYTRIVTKLLSVRKTANSLIEHADTMDQDALRAGLREAAETIKYLTEITEDCYSHARIVSLVKRIEDDKDPHYVLQSG
jgi:hypothetical protein